MSLKLSSSSERMAVICPHREALGPPCILRLVKNRVTSSVRLVNNKDASRRENREDTQDLEWIVLLMLRYSLEILRLTLGQPLVLALNRDLKHVLSAVVPRILLERREEPWLWKNFSRVVHKLLRNKSFRAAQLRPEALNKLQKRRRRLDYRCLKL